MHAKITKDMTAVDEYAWFYNVDDGPWSIDYGSVESQQRAIQCVQYVMTHPDEYEVTL